MKKGYKHTAAARLNMSLGHKKRIYGKHRTHRKEDINVRFWKNVNKTENCWIWKGSMAQAGYGLIWYNQKLYRAHRLVWLLTFGELDPKLEICHKCDNPPCVNPQHLFPGTHRDNMYDAIKKNRLVLHNGKKFLKGHKLNLGRKRSDITKKRMSESQKKRYENL